MKTTIIPAQITTVEDKIAGNLNMTQVLILMTPVFSAGIVYALFIPAMTFAWYKVVITIPVLIISFILSLRMDDKLVVNWLVLLLRYNLRPKYYVFNKNDGYLRVIDLPIFKKKDFKSTKFVRTKRKAFFHSFGIREQIAFERDKENIAFKVNKKGGFNVIFNEIEK